MSSAITTTAAFAGNATTIMCAAEPIREPARGLFDALVYSGNELVLIPRNELAKTILHNWMCMTAKQTATYRGVAKLGMNYGAGLESLTLLFSNTALLCSGDDPLSTGRRITAEEHAVALKAIEDHRASKGPKKKSRKRAA
jgi:hypothetical protein